MAGMPATKCCCVTCCPHCDPRPPQGPYQVTFTAPEIRLFDPDCCDDQEACDAFGGTFVLDYMGTYTACGTEKPCAYWQSAPFEIACEWDEGNPTMAILMLTLAYEEGGDLCVYYMGFAPASILENEPCNLTTLCTPGCETDLEGEHMFAVWTKGFTDTEDCEEFEMEAVCSGGFCMSWQTNPTVVKQ